jgi:hypothetical protein
VKHDFRKRGIELVKGVINLGLLSNIKGSQLSPLNQVLWLGPRSVLDTPGAARWLSFRLFGCCFRFLLVSGFSAVCDLRQQGSDSLYVFLSPCPDVPFPNSNGFGRRHLLGGNVTIKARKRDSEVLSSLPCGKSSHLEKFHR